MDAAEKKIEQQKLVKKADDNAKRFLRNIGANNKSSAIDMRVSNAICALNLKREHIAVLKEADFLMCRLGTLREVESLLVDLRQELSFAIVHIDEMEEDENNYEAECERLNKVIYDLKARLITIENTPKEYLSENPSK